tara:strand:- start:3311 stop:4276 length:966 start_codon:yes stop_codon:yes gene_type:complete
VKASETQNTLESAVDLLVQPEEISEPAEEVIKAEETQPNEDVTDEAENTYESGEDSTEESIDDSEEGDYEEPEYDAAQEELEIHDVRVDGDDFQVTLDELKQGYSGQKYVQKGMQQAAEARKQAETAYQNLTQERQQLQQLVDQLKNGEIAPPVKPDIAIREDDPIKYIESKMDYDDQVVKWNAVQHQLQAKTDAEMMARQNLAKQEAQILVEKMPELRDAEKATQFRQDIINVGMEVYGYPEEILGNITSHRDLMVLRDAMMYRKIMANQKTVHEKTKKSRPVIKPGNKKILNTQDAARKQREKLNKSGKIEDAIDLLFQ